MSPLAMEILNTYAQMKKHTHTHTHTQTHTHAQTHITLMLNLYLNSGVIIFVKQEIVTQKFLW